MATVVWEQNPHAILAMFSEGALDDREWESFVAGVRAGVLQGLPARALVLAEGAPAPAQRAKLEAALAPIRAHVKIAILTGSTFVRGVVNAFALVTPGYRAFSPNRIDDALVYLDIRPGAVDEIHAAVLRLRVRLRQP